MNVGESKVAGPRLREPENPVDRRSVRMWRLQATGIALIGLVLAIVVPARAGLATGLVIALIAAVALCALAYAAIMPLWRYRVHRWEATEEAVYTRSGWFVQEWRVAPMSRIQTVDTVRGPLHQWLGISTVTVTTASAAGAIEIEALDRDLAERLVERLTATAEAARGDAT
ncbi:MAG TPA: PH domain-containing protein [Solirubrobacterales bacterium]|nr:PH domain-containing protein [Solirubrobacterales bacterium]